MPRSQESTMKLPTRLRDSTGTGTRVPGPDRSWGPGVTPWPGDVTWSHRPPNSSYATITIVPFAHAEPSIDFSSWTRWLLPSRSRTRDAGNRAASACPRLLPQWPLRKCAALHPTLAGLSGPVLPLPWTCSTIRALSTSALMPPHGERRRRGASGHPQARGKGSTSKNATRASGPRVDLPSKR